MKKLVAVLLTLVLATSMMFGAAPMAFASDLSSHFNTAEVTPPSTDPGCGADVPADAIPGTSASPAIIDSGTTATSTSTNPDTSAPASEPPFDMPQDTTNNNGALTEASGADDPAKSETVDQTQTSASTGVVTVLNEQALGAARLETFGRDDDWHDHDREWALIELGRALDDLYRTLKSATGPAIVRIDEGSLTEENPSASFEEGAYYTKIISLVNRINDLLEQCDLPHGAEVSSLPMSVVGKVPEGFRFEDNTLTLVDMDLLKFNGEIDEAEAKTRAYEIKLQLKTGVYYVDSWLFLYGFNGLAQNTFTIELLLTEGGDGTVIPPVIDPPEVDPPVVDPPVVDPPVIDPPVIETPASSPLIGTYSALDTPVAPLSTETEEPATSETDETDEASPVSTVTAAPTIKEIPDAEIPMASMMVADSEATTVANTGIAAVSVLLSGASIAAIRPRKIGAVKGSGAAASSQGSSPAAFLGIGFGAISITVFVLSQYITGSTTAMWTPILLSISIVQVVCLAALHVNRRMTEKKAESRFKIRY